MYSINKLTASLQPAQLTYLVLQQQRGGGGKLKKPHIPTYQDDVWSFNFIKLTLFAFFPDSY